MNTIGVGAVRRALALGVVVLATWACTGSSVVDTNKDGALSGGVENKNTNTAPGDTGTSGSGAASDLHGDEGSAVVDAVVELDAPVSGGGGLADAIQTSDGVDGHDSVVEPAMTCGCWPTGESCEPFGGKGTGGAGRVEWPQCPDDTICTGDAFGAGECRAPCQHPDVPGSSGEQCPGGLECKWRPLTDVNGDKVTTIAFCYPTKPDSRLEPVDVKP